jgi:hypothetical protein
MLGHARQRRSGIVAASILSVTIGACADQAPPSGVVVPPGTAIVAVNADNHHAAAGDTKAFIGGWLEGRAEAVALRYTRSFFCEEPPSSAAEDTDCEVGAAAEVFPRAGNLPKIYALAPAFQPLPDPTTIHCVGGVVCPNHPPHLDLSRAGGGPNVFAPAHSHIILDRQGGWHQTVNIRIGRRDLWDQIAYEPDGRRLEKVRELQANSALVTGGFITLDRPTNIFFFFEVHNKPSP